MTAWTAERRQKHAEAIRRWKPWTKSTGPKTAAGKARAAQNAYKHGMRSLHRRLMDRALAAQRECLRLADTFRRARELNMTNELLAQIRARFHACDYLFHTLLYRAVTLERLCKKLAFSGANRQIVNANDN